MARSDRRTAGSAHALTVIVTAVLLAGCTTDHSEPDATPVPGASTTTGTTGVESTSTTPAGPASSIITTGAVQVSVRTRARSGPAGDALRTFLLERTRSIIAGAATRELRQVSSAAEYTRQRHVVSDAAQRGLTVPTRPLAVVVEARRPGTGRVQLGVCLWLPSTEFVDEVTGVSPAGPVPEEWLPAVAEVSHGPVTWIVDRLASPRTAFVPDCGGLI